jgi:hypothetical protein
MDNKINNPCFHQRSQNRKTNPKLWEPTSHLFSFEIVSTGFKQIQRNSIMIKQHLNKIHSKGNTDEFIINKEIDHPNSVGKTRDVAEST